MRKTVQWAISGMTDAAEAERRLEDMTDWARRSFNLDLFEVESGIRHGAFGLRAEIILTQIKEETSET